MGFAVGLALLLQAVVFFSNTLFVEAQVQLLNITDAPGLSATCIAVLNQAVNCTTTIASIGNVLDGSPVFGTPLFLTSSQLSGLCNTACSVSLTTWERRIAGACGATLYDATDGGQFALALFAEQYVEAYSSVCLMNKAGAYCNRVIGDLMRIDPANQRATATPVSTAYCDDCYLSLLSTQLAMPLASAADLKSLFVTLTSSCKKTGWTLSAPPTATTFTIPPTQPPAAVCSGTTYTISSTDTCVGISMNKGISTDDLLSYNYLSSLCKYFPKAGTSLCIPDSHVCKPYMVLKADTCSSIQSQFKISYAQLIAWNPSLGGKCSNIQQYVGYAICVSNPGGNYVNPSPTTIIPSSTATSLWTYSLPAMTSYPNATYVASTADAPYANGTRMDCTNYFTAPILTNYTGNGTTSFSCEDAVSQFDIDMADFLAWNPSLSALSPCTMTNNTQYCVQTYRQTSKNITGSCVQKAIAPPGYDCIGFTSRHGIDQDQFALWNPEVGSDCGQFKIGTQYCIDVLHYRQPGITSNCNKFVAANNTNWVELPCQIIETEFGISHARFIAWNPAVQDNCTGLYLGYDYCVSIPNYRPTYTSTTPFATALPSPAALPNVKSNAKGSSSSLPKGKATVTLGSSKSTKSNSLNRQLTVPTPTGM
ncbi:hypothetical protein J3F84DRAFT_368307 [Trichoderma pleuroticola]